MTFHISFTKKVPQLHYPIANLSRKILAREKTCNVYNPVLYSIRLPPERVSHIPSLVSSLVLNNNLNHVKFPSSGFIRQWPSLPRVVVRPIEAITILPFSH